MLRRVLVRAFIPLIMISVFCTAQEIKPSNDTGLRPLTPYFTGDGNVNLTNGNLNVVIPLITLPGRNGLDYTFGLVYDSKIWSPHPSYAAANEAHYQWTDDSSYYGGGW